MINKEFYDLVNLSFFHFIDGVDFIGVTQKIAFTGSGETHCINISILKDSINEFDEHFLLDLTLLYTAFDIPLQQINITILDSGELCISYPFPRFSNNLTSSFPGPTQLSVACRVFMCVRAWELGVWISLLWDIIIGCL